MGETASSFLFSNIKIWGRINCGMVKITQMTRIADLITPFNSLHKVFEILLLILPLGTTEWRFMHPMVPLRPKTFRGREHFPWTSSRGQIFGIDPIRPESNGGCTSTSRERLQYEILSLVHLPLLPGIPTLHTLLFRGLFFVVIRLFIARSRFRLGFYSGTSWI
jgi:hypothetical protein